MTVSEVAVILDMHGVIIKDFPVDKYILAATELLRKHGYDYEDAKKEYDLLM